MKDKIMFLIIGVLIGAIITAACFLFLQKANHKNIPNKDFNFEKPMMEEFNEEKHKGEKRREFDMNDVPQETVNQLDREMEAL